MPRLLKRIADRSIALCGIATLLIFACAPGAANAGPRVALVIGNSTYQNVPDLPTPADDATDISAALTRLGFSVNTLTNAKYDDMRRALIEFGQQSRGADMAVVFFAGHGIQMDNDNWLIPIDAQLATDLDVAHETIGLQPVMRAVSNASKLGLVILDASRNNPFLPKMQIANGQNAIQRAIQRGFSQVDPLDNVLVAYAAKEGTTASDGNGRNSPFTQSLLKNIETPGLEIDDLFRVVRDDVLQSTRREQQPVLYGSLSGEMVYLKPPVIGTSPSAPAGNQEANLSVPDQQIAPAAQKAVLYEEDPKDPQGRTYKGTVIWHTEKVAAKGGRQPDVAIDADIEVPARKLKIKMSIRRNTDAALPATHTADLTFTLPPDFDGGGIASVPGIMMKSSEQARGTPLAGLAVKVTDGFFMVGLSNADADKTRNIQLLKEKMWFDIPLVYSNQHRAILAVGKDALGERVFNDVFAQWAQ